jgi:hypothetical protein
MRAAFDAAAAGAEQRARTHQHDQSALRVHDGPILPRGGGGRKPRNTSSTRYAHHETRLDEDRASGVHCAREGNMQTVLLVGSSWAAGAAPRDLAEVTVAASPTEARALGETFDVGVFDLDLPDPCGIELAEELLSAARIGRAVFFTGASWQPVLRRAARVGALVEKGQGPAALWAELGL